MDCLRSTSLLSVPHFSGNCNPLSFCKLSILSYVGKKPCSWVASSSKLRSLTGYHHQITAPREHSCQRVTGHFPVNVCSTYDGIYHPMRLLGTQCRQRKNSPIKSLPIKLWPPLLQDPPSLRWVRATVFTPFTNLWPWLLMAVCIYKLNRLRGFPCDVSDLHQHPPSLATTAEQDNIHRPWSWNRAEFRTWPGENLGSRSWKVRH